MNTTTFYGKVLDLGGKKEKKRGLFRPPLDKVESWEYLNIDESTNPDYCCNAESIPIDDNTFDIIISTEVFEYLKDYKIVLKEVYRVVKNDGKIILTIPFMNPIHGDYGDRQRWTPLKIEEELHIAGFKNIEIKPMGSLFGVIYDLVNVSFGLASKNKSSIKNRVVNNFFMPIITKTFLWLDNKYIYKSKYITTGYYIEAKK